MNVRNYAGLPVGGALPDPFEKIEVEAPAADNGGANSDELPAAIKKAGSVPYTPAPPKAPASAQEAAQNDPTPIPYANNASGRTDEEQADAEETERQLRKQHGYETD
jgi:hypothetical protein